MQTLKQPEQIHYQGFIYCFVIYCFASSIFKIIIHSETSSSETNSNWVIHNYFFFLQTVTKSDVVNKNIHLVQNN